jgi:hypothetical protein
MKTFFVLALMLTGFLRASAQVDVELAMDQDQFLPNEPVRLAVKITNRSGQTLHLGADPGWLTFTVESDDNYIVIKNSEVPVVEPFDLESSQMATKRVDLQPYFVMSKPGRYRVVATMRIKDWGATRTSAPKRFDIISGVELWSQDFGVPVADSQPPEARKYTLVQANYLREQLQLYVQISSGDGMRILKVAALGPLVSFSSPQAQVDRISQLHILWQTGAQSFTYTVMRPDGTAALRDTYENFNSRPRLGVNTNGDVVVVGGVRRAKPTDAPVQKPAPAVTNSSVPASFQH